MELVQGQVTLRNDVANSAKGTQNSPRNSGARKTQRSTTHVKSVTPKPSKQKLVEIIGDEKKNAMPKARHTTPKTKNVSTLNEELGSLATKLPVLFANSNLNSPEGKLAQLSLLDDTLMSLSLVADTLQKQVSRESERYEPDTVQALCNVSKEIRSLMNTKLEIAKEFAKLEFRKIRMAMEVERHARSLIE